MRYMFHWMLVALIPVLSGCCSSSDRRPVFRRFQPGKRCDCGDRLPVVPRGRLTPRPDPDGGDGLFLPRDGGTPPPTDRIPPQSRGSLLPSERWRSPRRPEVRLLPPDLSVPGPRETEKPPRVKEDRKKPPVTKPLPPEPRIKEKSIPDLPVDIPAFVKVKEDVYSGQKPFSEGLNWLKEKGFKTIVHVLSPDEDETTSRLKFEAKGFKYVPIKVSPKTLDRKQVDELNHIVSDATNYPIFVYDRDTSLTGGLWYLHFRIVDRMTDEQARAEASRIGFKEDEDGTHRQMWLAIQRFLQNQKPK